MFRSKGFSQNITFLCFADSEINGICVAVEDAIKITWMLLSLKAFEGLDIFVDPNFFEL